MVQGEDEAESSLGRVPEASYNASKFIAMARDPQFFRQQLPRVVKEVVAEQPLPLDSGQAAVVRQLMYDATHRLWNEGSHRLLMWVYREYATERGLEVERDTEILGRIKTIKGIEELSPEEALKWQTYLDTTDLPREVAVEAVKRILYLLDLPSVRRIDDPSVRFLHTRLESVPYQIALTILPDINDEEAKKLFGQLTDAEKVHKLAVDLTETR